MTELQDMTGEQLVYIVSHSSWCGLPDCLACKHNKEYVDELKRRLLILDHPVCKGCARRLDYDHKHLNKKV